MTPQELKNSILQLAIQGKLVEQRPEEGTAEELYRQIQQEKQRLIKEGKIKKEKPLPEITGEEKPFDIPDSWIWVRVRDCISNRAGLAYDKTNLNVHSDDMIRVLRGGNIMDMYYSQKPDDVLISREFVNPDLLLKRNTIITPAVTSLEHVGKMGRVEQDYDDMVVGGFVLMLVPHICDDTFSLFLLSAFSSKYFRDCCRGIVNKSGQAFYNLSREKMMGLTIPFPPLAEQKRIVAKVEELLPLIDRYEKAWSRLEEFNKRFPDDMQKSILQMAIQGKLVEQRPEEGTGEELYQQIQAEKQKLIKEGKFKKEKPLPEITEDEKPFDIPENWKWVRFGNISNIIGTGIIKSNSEQFSSAQYSYFKMNNIGNFDGKCHFDNMPMIYATDHERDRYKLEEGDFLFNTRNSRELVGKTAVVPPINQTILFNNNILKIKFYEKIDPQYINLYFNSPLGRSEIVKFISNTTNVAAIYQRQIITLPIPLPPIAEQKRIVAALSSIIPLCTRLMK